MQNTGGITATGGEDVSEYMNQIGEEFGRNGDTVLGHLTEGEIVIPVPVLEKNPAIKKAVASVFNNHNLEMGRFIVGDELNVINPDTGQPEFGLSDDLKKILKVAAPILLPIVMPSLLKSASAGIGGFSHLGRFGQGLSTGLDYASRSPFLSSGLGAGVGILAAGGNSDDFLKAFAIGGSIGGIMNLAGGGSGGFFGANAPAPAGAVATAAPDGPKVEMGVDTASAANMDLGFDTGASIGQPSTIQQNLAQGPGGQNYSQGMGANAPSQPVNFGFTPTAEFSTPASANVRAERLAAEAPPTNVDTTGQVNVPEAGGFYQDKVAPQLKKIPVVGDALAAAGQYAVKNPLPVLTAGAYAAGAFDEEEEKSPNERIRETSAAMPTGFDYLAANPSMYGPSREQFFGNLPGGSNFVAQGEPDFASYRNNPPAQLRASGGAINGAGTGTSDSIPAMLSDGEFVMTAEAVRNAGGGNRKAGAQRMYDLMHHYESMGA